MPNRIIRESCRTSPTLAQLSHGAERLFWRLTTVADDFGRFEADPMVMLAQCFPNMLNSIKIGDVERWIADVSRCDLLRTYVSNGKTYGFFVTWDKHQIKRARASKYPEPPPASRCSQPLANVSEKREARSESSDVPRSEEAATSLVSAPMPYPAFDAFWKAYPKHIGKGEALKAWKHGRCEDNAPFILAAVERQLPYFQDQGAKYTPNPATWLNQKRWDDDPPTPSPVSEKTRGNLASLQAFVDRVNGDAPQRLPS